MKLILRFLKPHWKLFLLTVFLLIVDVAGALIIPTLASEMLQEGEMGVEMQVLINTAVVMAVAAVISGAGGIMSGYVCAELVSRVAKDMRDALYKKSLDLSVSDFRAFGVASMTTRTVSDITNIQFALMASIQIVLPVPVVFVISLILAFMKDWMMGLILLAVLAVITVVALFIMRSASPLFRKLQKLLDRMSTVLLENITGVRVVRAFNKEEHEHQRLDTSFSDYAVTSIKANRMFASLDGLSFFAVNLFVIIVYALSGYRVTAGAFLVTDITAIVEYAILALLYMMMAQMVILTLPRAFECAGRVKAVLDFSPTIQDLTDKQVWFPATSENVVEFRNAAFRFPDSEEYTLKNLNFSCRRGETTAIIGGTGSGKSTVASLILRFNDVTDGELLLNNVNIRKMPQNQLRDHIAYVQQRAWLFAGTIAENLRYSNPNATDEDLWHALKIAVVGATGAGKTTLINLLMRFYEVNGGRITIDGIPTTELTRSGLRHNFGMVLQDTWLFGGTIAENIAYGKPDATREEIVRAAKMAKADYFIRTMPQGYDTVLDNDAGNLSVGQRQLLTIARVFLCNPPVLILDEATSSVDTRTEAEIGKATQALMSGRTSFVIAHRLSTIRDANCILFMEQGNIIEQGTHKELLAKGGAYAALYNSQFA